MPGPSAELIERYTRAGWWGSHTVGDLVRNHATDRPDGLAYITPARKATWREYDVLADRIARAIGAIGAEPGDRVAIYLPDGLAVHAALVGAQRAGVIAVGIGARAGDAEIAYLITRTGARTLVGLRGYRDRSINQLLVELDRHGAYVEHYLDVDDHDQVQIYGVTATAAEPTNPPDLDPDAMAGRAHGPNDFSLLNSTSGTTGLPKCVMQFENRWFHISDLAFEAGDLGSDEIFFSTVPAPFGFGLWTSHFAAATIGAPTVVLPRFDADEMVRLIERERVTVLCCVSTQFRMLLNSPLAKQSDLSSLRVMFTGGEAIPFEQAREFEATTGATVLQFFGSNESGAFSYTTMRDDARQRLTTAGQLIEHMNVRLFDEEGRDITSTGGPGQPGGTGPLTCLGYYDDAAANGQLYAADGSLLMGDLVTVDDNYLTLVGRTSDIVIRGGKNISAAQVEAEVSTHPAVALVSVVAVPDSLFGERVCAVVVVRPEHTLTLEELGAHLRHRGMTRELHPEHLLIVEDMPRSSGGKVAKGETRRLAEQLISEQVGPS